MRLQIGVNFHGIGAAQRPLEPGEAPYWLNNARFEHVLDRIAEAPDPSVFSITFDDGNRSDLDVALPALVARGLRARFFVLTGRLGHAGSLDAGGLRTLLQAGMTIGSHGVNHTVWPRLDHTALSEELRGSRARLEDICGCAVREAGIPFGRYDRRVLRNLCEAGYISAWSSDGGRFRPNTFLRPRTSLRADMSGAEIDRILTGYLPPPRQFRRVLGMACRRWIVTG